MEETYFCSMTAGQLDDRWNHCDIRSCQPNSRRDNVGEERKSWTTQLSVCGCIHVRPCYGSHGRPGWLTIQGTLASDRRAFQIDCAAACVSQAVCTVGSDLSVRLTSSITGRRELIMCPEWEGRKGHTNVKQALRLQISL
jgi:hypothetical protein